MTKKEIARKLAKIDISNLSKSDIKTLNNIITSIQDEQKSLTYTNKIVKSLCDEKLKYKDSKDNYFYYGGYYFFTNNFYLLKINRKYVDKKLLTNFKKAEFNESQVKCAKALLNIDGDYFKYSFNYQEYNKGYITYVSSLEKINKDIACVRFVDSTQLINTKLFNFFLNYLENVEFNLYLSGKSMKPILLFTDELKLAIMPMAPAFVPESMKSGFYVKS